MKLGTDTGSLINHVYATAKQLNPARGMGATVLHWTDRSAGTVVEVTETSFTVQADIAIRTDGNGMSDAQSYAYRPDPNGARATFKRLARGRDKGQWRQDGRAGGAAVVLGKRDQYHDYSF